MLLFFFFFQAEDGIRDKLVTGVQTCALPIWLGTFIGEQVTPANVPSLSLVICSDGYPLSTTEVYSKVNLASLTRSEPATNISELVSCRRPISELLVNDLEMPAAAVHPAVLSLKAELVQ